MDVFDLVNIQQLISSWFGLSASMLKFPDFIFFIIIPFVFCFYILRDLFQRIRIFRRAEFVNSVLSFLILVIFLRWVYPLLFAISIFYYIIGKRFYGSIKYEIFVKCLVLGILAFLYIYLLPFLSSLVIY
jgi:hypothetical protein